jgi:hypothetical protein
MSKNANYIYPNPFVMSNDINSDGGIINVGVVNCPNFER